jgi:hypothetical protein
VPCIVHGCAEWVGGARRNEPLYPGEGKFCVYPILPEDESIMTNEPQDANAGALQGHPCAAHS